MRLRGFTDQAQIEGNITDAQRAAHEAEVREARLRAARHNARWVELREIDLVRRHRMFVHAPSDQLYKFRLGDVWVPHEATVLADPGELTYFAGSDGEMTFVEPFGLTYSAWLERRAERERLKAMPRRPQWVKP